MDELRARAAGEEQLHPEAQPSPLVKFRFLYEISE